MGLRNIVVPRTTVEVSEGQTIAVRGISLFDIMSVLGEYGPQMSLMFSKITEGREPGQRFDNATVAKHIRELAREFPDVMAAAIALACDDYSPEGMAVAKTLPLTAQLETLDAIFRQTFRSEGDVGKLLGLLIRAATSMKEAVNQQTMASPDGIGVSDAN